MSAATRPMTVVHVRWTIQRDLTDVIDIEGMVADDPWSEDGLLEALRQKNRIGHVAEYGDRVVGHMVYELRDDRIVLLRLAVHPAYQRRKVGFQMVRKLLGKLTAARRTLLEVTVRESNLRALAFFKAIGFVGSLDRGAFPDEDGVEMRFDIDTRQ